MSWLIFIVGCVTLYLLGRYHERSRNLEKEKYGTDRSWIGKAIDVTVNRATGLANHNRRGSRCDKNLPIRTEK